eukprot:6187066-Pleurochrysis_carterae.AAC.5
MRFVIVVIQLSGQRATAEQTTLQIEDRTPSTAPGYMQYGAEYEGTDWLTDYRRWVYWITTTLYIVTTQAVLELHLSHSSAQTARELH